MKIIHPTNVTISGGGGVIGQPIVGGDPNSVLYVDGAGLLANDSSFQYDSLLHNFLVAGNPYASVLAVEGDSGSVFLGDINGDNNGVYLTISDLGQSLNFNSPSVGLQIAGALGSVAWNGADFSTNGLTWLFKGPLNGTKFVIDDMGVQVTSNVSLYISLNQNSPLGVFVTNSQHGTQALAAFSAIGDSTGVTMSSVSTLNGNTIIAGNGVISTDTSALVVNAKTNIIFTNGLATELARFSGATGNLGIGAAPNAVTILDLTSTTQGFRLPRMTTAQRTAITTTNLPGIMVYDITLDGVFYTNNAGNWVQA